MLAILPLFPVRSKSEKSKYSISQVMMPLSGSLQKKESLKLGVALSAITNQKWNVNQFLPK